jgi:hypothetical protein
MLFNGLTSSYKTKNYLTFDIYFNLYNLYALKMYGRIDGSMDTKKQNQERNRNEIIFRPVRWSFKIFFFFLLHLNVLYSRSTTSNCGQWHILVFKARKLPRLETQSSNVKFKSRKGFINLLIPPRFFLILHSWSRIIWREITLLVCTDQGK